MSQQEQKHLCHQSVPERTIRQVKVMDHVSAAGWTILQTKPDTDRLMDETAESCVSYFRWRGFRWRVVLRGCSAVADRSHGYSVLSEPESSERSLGPDHLHPETHRRERDQLSCQKMVSDTKPEPAV